MKGHQQIDRGSAPFINQLLENPWNGVIKINIAHCLKAS